MLLFPVEVLKEIRRVFNYEIGANTHIQKISIVEEDIGGDIDRYIKIRVSNTSEFSNEDLKKLVLMGFRKEVVFNCSLDLYFEVDGVHEVEA